MTFSEPFIWAARDLLTAATFAVAILIFLFGIDDLVIDIAAFARRLYRRLVIYRRHRPLHEEDLKRVPEQWVAVMIPAWREAAVIERMLETAATSYLYRNYRLFVGCYANDLETCERATAAAARHPQVIPVVLPREGPTSKADCLNGIFARIRDHELRENVTFAIFVLHDAEDVVHPLELRLFNYLIPRKDMVQLPVIPLERPLLDFTGGHYMDEFAELHGKDLLARELLFRQVPSAGVGCAFSRRAVTMMAERRGGEPFNSASLTEDYDFALQLKYLGLSQIFVRFAVTRAGPRHRRDRVATREFFPDSFGAACRQKARWLLGMVFQSMRLHGWRGPWRLKYALWRDRKGLFTAFTGIIAYVLAIGWGLLWLAPMWSGADPAPAMPPALVLLLWVNATLLANRSLQRALAVWSVYGPAQALMSVPRQVWGNVINCCAGLRAIFLFARHLATGKPLAWDKTQHAFPTAEELRPFHARIGQQLLRKGLVDGRRLRRALRRQRRTGEPLGLILGLEETALYEALAEQWGLPFRRDLSGANPAPMSSELAARHEVLALVTDDGGWEIAAARPLGAAEKATLAAACPSAPRWTIAPPSLIRKDRIPAAAATNTAALLLFAVLLSGLMFQSALAASAHDHAAAGFAAYDAGDYRTAAAAFERALSEKPDLPLVAAQLGYAYRKLGRNRDAARAFRQALATGPELDMDARHRLRREVQVSENAIDFSLYHVHRSAALSTRQVSLTGPSLTQSQSGAELSWLPPGIGYRDGRVFRLGGRILWGYEGKSLDPRGESVQAGIGASYKPFAAHNLVFGAERLIAVGDEARDDWMLRAGYSWARGYGADFAKRSWPYFTFYGEAAVIDPGNPDLLLAAEARAGRSFRLMGDGFGPVAVATPHATLAASRQKDSFAGTDLVEGGPGVSFKLHFADSPASAHGGSIELLLQYRAKIAGDSAGGSGLVLTLILLR